AAAVLGRRAQIRLRRADGRRRCGRSAPRQPAGVDLRRPGAGGEEQRQPRRRERAAGAAPALDWAVAATRAESCAPVARIEGTVMNIAIHRLATRAALAAI